MLIYKLYINLKRLLQNNQIFRDTVIPKDKERLSIINLLIK